MKGLFAAVLAAFLLPIAAPAQERPLRIGYITDLSGPGAFFGVPGLRGIQFAIHSLKAAPIATTEHSNKENRAETNNIELKVEDSKSQPAEAVSAAIRLLDEEKVDAIICDLTQVCTALSPKVAAAKKPLIYHSPSLAIENSNSFAFRNFLDYEDACGALARELHASGAKNIGSLAANLEFGELCFRGIEKIIPGHFSYRYNPGDDLRSAVIEFKRRGIDSVILVGFEPDVVAWFKHNQSLNYRPRQAFIELLLNDVIRNAAGSLLRDALVAGFSDLPDTFERDLNSIISGPQNKNIQSSAITFNAILALHAAFDSCPKRDQACLDQALQMGKPGLMGFRGFQHGAAPYPTKVKHLN